MQPTVSDPYCLSHLLGLFLADGRLEPTRHGQRLLLRLDGRDPGAADDAEVSLVLLTMGCAVHRTVRGGGSVTVTEESWTGWPALLPRAGPGRGHDRAIALEDWQRELVGREPEAFLRGLVAADGCRTVNRFTTRLPSGRVAQYAYPRYFFSHGSAEVRGLFCAACERIGVSWTQGTARSVSVARRDSVAILDEVIGPTA